MKEYYAPIKQPGRSGVKISIPTWVPLAKMYKFERLPDGSLNYSPVIQ
jgi:hypothetical protein